MGYSYTAYFGPVVVCKHGERKVIQKIDFCETCQIKRTGNFCGVCGTKITQKEEIKTLIVPTRQECFDFFEEMGLDYENALFCPESSGKSCNYFPNQKRGRIKNYSIDMPSVMFLEMTQTDYQDVVDWFEREYAKEVEALRKLYTEVEVKYGLTTYVL